MPPNPDARFEVCGIRAVDGTVCCDWMGHTAQTFSFPVPVLRELINEASLCLVREDVVEFTRPATRPGSGLRWYLTARKPTDAR